MAARTLLAVLTALAALPSTAAPTTHRVPSEYPTIQAAVDASSDGDLVLVAPGTYTGPGNRNVVADSRDVAIMSEAGPTLTIIDVQGTPANPGRGITTGLVASLILEGFTIKNGYITGYDHGGAVKVRFATVVLDNCIFQNNAVEGVGGGVFANSGGSHPSMLTIRNCTFEDNSALTGGGLHSYTRDVLVEDCIFRGNFAEEAGGAIGTGNDGYIRNCIFEDNWVAAADIGGAVFASSGSLSALDLAFESCIFYRNAGGSILAVAATTANPLTIRGCTFYGNDVLLPAAQGGATIAVGTDTTTAAVLIENTILAAASAGSAVTCQGSSSATISCTDIHGNPGGDWTGCISDQFQINNNQSVDPFFCDPDHGNLTLQEQSACAPENSGGCGLVGALPVACGVVALEPATWGSIKAMFK